MPGGGSIGFGHRSEYGINANVIRKWLPRHGTATMLPVTVETGPGGDKPSRRHARATRGATRPPIDVMLAGATVRVPPGSITKCG